MNKKYGGELPLKGGRNSTLPFHYDRKHKVVYKYIYYIKSINLILTPGLARTTPPQIVLTTNT